MYCLGMSSQFLTKRLKRVVASDSQLTYAVEKQTANENHQFSFTWFCTSFLFFLRLYKKMIIPFTLKGENGKSAVISLGFVIQTVFSRITLSEIV